MCKFCETYKIMREKAESMGIKVSFSSGLACTKIGNGELNTRVLCGLGDRIPFPLNYCPECGKKLMED